MVEFIYSGNKDKDQKWNQLARSSRDNNNEFSRISIAQTIDILDRKFVGKLYDHRSYLIHSKVDRGSRNFSINLMAAVCVTHIFTSDKLNKNFKELKEESKMNNITLQYALIWIIKKSISSMVQILIALKSYMEDNKKVDKLPIFIKGQMVKLYQFQDHIGGINDQLIVNPGPKLALIKNTHPINLGSV